MWWGCLGWHASAASRGGQGQCLWPGRLGCWSLFIRRGTGVCVPITGGSHSSATLGNSMPGYWRGEFGQCSTLDSGGTVRFSSRSWNTGPALYPFQGAGGWMGVAQPIHMCFVDLEKVFNCVPRVILWGFLWEYGVLGPVAKGCPVPVQPEQELGSHCLISQ